MSQKVHPTGFRLNVTQINPTQFQCYGRVPKAYPLIALEIQKSFNLLNRISHRLKIHLSNCEWILKNDRLLSNVLYTSYENFEKIKGSVNSNWINKNSFLKDSTVIQIAPTNIINDWVRNSINIRFYRVHWLHDPKTLASWISNQLLQRQSVKIVLKLLKKELSKNGNWEHETKTFISGSVKFRLTGIKIVCRGRLRGKRQRMSNKVSKQLGVMPLQTLNTFIEYEKTSLCTRFGKVGIHIYYHYSIA